MTEQSEFAQRIINFYEENGDENNADQQLMLELAKAEVHKADPVNMLQLLFNDDINTSRSMFYSRAAERMLDLVAMHVAMHCDEDDLSTAVVFLFMTKILLLVNGELADPTYTIDIGQAIDTATSETWENHPQEFALALHILKKDLALDFQFHSDTFLDDGIAALLKESSKYDTDHD